MMITVTSIRLKSVWHFFKLSLHGLHISRQARSEKGFIRMKNTGFGFMHYTVSAWESEADLKRFARSGAHLDAMKAMHNIAEFVQTRTYEGNTMPNWQQAKEMLAQKG